MLVQIRGGITQTFRVEFVAVLEIQACKVKTHLGSYGRVVSINNLCALRDTNA